MLFLHSESDCVLVDKVLRKEGGRERGEKGRQKRGMEGWMNGWMDEGWIDQRT